MHISELRALTANAAPRASCGALEGTLPLPLSSLSWARTRLSQLWKRHNNKRLKRNTMYTACSKYMHAVYYAMENVLGKNDMRPIVIILYRRKWLMVTDNNSMRASGECIQVYTLHSWSQIVSGPGKAGTWYSNFSIMKGQELYHGERLYHMRVHIKHLYETKLVCARKVCSRIYVSYVDSASHPKWTLRQFFFFKTNMRYNK